MSEKDLNRKATEADLENVSGGAIETQTVEGTGFLGRRKSVTQYRANVNGVKGAWHSDLKDAKAEEQKLGNKYILETVDSRFGTVLNGKLKDQ